MPKATASRTAAYRCAECGNELAKWVGRCPECQAWGTVNEAGAKPGSRVSAGRVNAAAMPIGHVTADKARHRPTGIAERLQ